MPSNWFVHLVRTRSDIGSPNPFASICGRVCAAPSEAKYRPGALDGAVSIRALKPFVREKFGVESSCISAARRPTGAVTIERVELVPG